MKSKQEVEGSLQQDVHHKNATDTLSQTFGAAQHLIPRNLEGDSESNSYTAIQSECFRKFTNMKLLEARVLAYDIMAPFIIPDLLYEYAFEVKY